MFVRLEKVIPEKRQKRFYVMIVAKTLFDEWCLVREWGRIGSSGGQRKVDYTESEEEAVAALYKLSDRKFRGGYHQCEMHRDN